MQQELGTPVYLNYEDTMWLRPLNGYHIASKINKSIAPKDINNLEEGNSIKVGDLVIKVIHTPGHSKGSVCFYIKDHNILFSGDTMFEQTYGRTDLPGASQIAINESIKRLLTLPDKTLVLPGHGPETTIG